MFNWWRKKAAEPASPPAKPRARRRISHSLLLAAQAKTEPVQHATYQPAPGVVPADKKAAALAMDDMPYGYINGPGAGLFGTFPGYPALAELAQLPEYRKMVGTIADEMTRKWIKVLATGDDGDKSERIAAIEVALRTFKVRDVFRAATEHDGYFGRGQIFIDVKTPSGVAASRDPDELAAPLFVSDRKITKDSLLGLRCVEPMWTYPSQYNATNPLSETFYRPESWYVMGQTVHASRFLMLIARPVPDMLKAVYSFGGLSLSQIAKPYVDNWLRTRDSVSDTVHSFSTSGIKTNMEAELASDEGSAPVSGSVIDRAQLFNSLRDNRGLMVLDKEVEDFFQFNTPLGGLDALQAQSQEQMASVSNIPLVKLLGITPAGLNANSDGEIRVFYDWINSQQEKLYREPLKKVMDILQLSLFGDIDAEIDFRFEPLYQLSDVEMATANKAKADTDAVLVNAGIIAPEESRERLARETDGPYQALDLSADPDSLGGEDEEGEGEEGADTAKDEAFKEADHPRDKDGKFGSGTPSAKANFGTKKKANVQEAMRAIREVGYRAEEYRKPGSSSAAVYSNGAIHINTSHKFWADPVSSTANATNLSSKDPNHILNHEIGHAIYDAPDNFSPYTHQDIARQQVSKYAAMNPKEFVSEVYAGMHAGKEFSPEVMQMFQQYAKQREGIKIGASA